MKKLIYGIYILFSFLMIFTIYMAASVNEGLVEEHYYERSKQYFYAKEAEEELGFSVSISENISTGDNFISARLSSKEGPLINASVVMSVASIATTDHDASYRMKETGNGIYGSDVYLPVKGRWMIKLDIEHEKIRTQRIWDITVE